jgi:hypothetical protein
MEGISKNSGNFATLVAYMLTYKKCGFYCRAADGVDGVTDDCTAACLAPATEKTASLAMERYVQNRSKRKHREKSANN